MSFLCGISVQTMENCWQWINIDSFFDVSRKILLARKRKTNCTLFPCSLGCVNIWCCGNYSCHVQVFFSVFFMSVSSSTLGFVAWCVSFFNGVIQSVSNVNDWCISCWGVGCTQHTQGILLRRFCPKVQPLTRVLVTILKEKVPLSYTL